MAADSNLLGSIGCAEERRRRCLVSVAGDLFFLLAGVRAPLFVCFNLIYCRVAVAIRLTVR